MCTSKEINNHKPSIIFVYGLRCIFLERGSIITSVKSPTKLGYVVNISVGYKYKYKNDLVKVYCFLYYFKRTPINELYMCSTLLVMHNNMRKILSLV